MSVGFDRGSSRDALAVLRDVIPVVGHHAVVPRAAGDPVRLAVADVDPVVAPSAVDGAGGFARVVGQGPDRSRFRNARSSAVGGS